MKTSTTTIMTIAACAAILMGACGRKDTSNREVPQEVRPADSLEAPVSTPDPMIANVRVSQEDPPEASEFPTVTPYPNIADVRVSIPVDPPAVQPSPTATLRPIDNSTQEKIDALKKRLEDQLNPESLTPSP